MSQLLEVAAPAKLNLFLHVTGRRPDGYHELESLMTLVDFGDMLTIERREDGQIVAGRPLPGVLWESDLCCRAALALQRETGCRLGATIMLEKRIPMGAGLGGGSSDAASVLLALNRLWGLRLSRPALQRIALGLGADVPFFVFGRAAHVTGVGEVLRPVTLPPIRFAVLVPPVHVATAAVFAAPDLPRATPVSRMQLFPLDHGRNDLEPVAIAQFPPIGAALGQLDRMPGDMPKARMTGSGAGVFRILGAGPADGLALPPGAFVVCSLARHPLCEFAEK